MANYTIFFRLSCTCFDISTPYTFVSLKSSKANPRISPATVPSELQGTNTKFGTLASLQSICFFTSKAAFTYPSVPITLLAPTGINNS